MSEEGWPLCYEPLDLLDAVPESAPHERLWRYVLLNLRGVGADLPAELLGRRLVGGLDDQALDAHRRAFAAQSRQRSGGGYSQGRQPVSLPLAAQRARAGVAALQPDPRAAAAEVTRETRHRLQRDQCAWLKCLFANPFRAAGADPAWLTATVLALARGVRESGDFGAMPILADALQDAGCDDEDVLTHCRDGSHVCGCWVVDLLLSGKECGPFTPSGTGCSGPSRDGSRPPAPA
ncbi:MAG: hypothetical protein J0I06_14095 [Planctomycetes bacterium]|nr:hypothetical protein [Planctomycetota bacterium]